MRLRLLLFVLLGTVSGDSRPVMDWWRGGHGRGTGWERENQAEGHRRGRYFVGLRAVRPVQHVQDGPNFRRPGGHSRTQEHYLRRLLSCMSHSHAGRGGHREKPDLPRRQEDQREIQDAAALRKARSDRHHAARGGRRHLHGALQNVPSDGSLYPPRRRPVNQHLTKIHFHLLYLRFTIFSFITATVLVHGLKFSDLDILDRMYLKKSLNSMACVTLFSFNYLLRMSIKLQEGTACLIVTDRFFFFFYLTGRTIAIGKVLKVIE